MDPKLDYCNPPIDGVLGYHQVYVLDCISWKIQAWFSMVSGPIIGERVIYQQAQAVIKIEKSTKIFAKGIKFDIKAEIKD